MDFYTENGVLKKYTGEGGQIRLAQGLTGIGDRAFSSCLSLEKITIPEGVLYLGDGAFLGCRSLREVILPRSLKRIGNYAFYGCRELSAVTLPPELTSIGKSAFSGCTGLEEILLPGSLEELGISAFFGCRGLRSAVLSGRMRTVGQFTFYGCTSLREIRIPEGLIDIGEKAFFGCTELISAVLPETLRHAAASAFDQTPEMLIFRMGDKPQTEADAAVLRELMDAGRTPAELRGQTEALFGLSPNEIPLLMDSRGVPCGPDVTAFLLTVHEWTAPESYRMFTFLDTPDPGICEAAQKVLTLLDQASVQAVLAELTDSFLGVPGDNLRMRLAFPVCRYADEETMTRLTERAVSQDRKLTGKDRSLFWMYRSAVLYSDTQAAMLFAYHHGDLRRYAVKRDSDEEALCDRYLAEAGLDNRRSKSYDLGTMSVTARLQGDYRFVIQVDGSEKKVKSIPKRGTDPDKYAEAVRDYTRLDRFIRRFARGMKHRYDLLRRDCLDGRTTEAERWKQTWLNNPILRDAAELLVWNQGKRYFTLAKDGAVDRMGRRYRIGDEPVRLAHPMDMTVSSVRGWQNYLTQKGILQPFDQLWEPVLKQSDIRPDRYRDCMIPLYQLRRFEAHGIVILNPRAEFNIILSCRDCRAKAERKKSSWIRKLSRFDTVEIREFRFEEYSRWVNHITACLDRLTLTDRIRKDDVTIAIYLSELTPEQLQEAVRTANLCGSKNCLALLLEEKNRRAPVFSGAAGLYLD